VRLRPLQAAEGLLRAADLRLAAAPREAEQLAHVAFRLLERVDPEDHPRARLVEVRVARWCVAAGARVLLGDDAGAERAFQQALGELTADADATARARYCRGLAGFRLAQRRHDEALGLLLRAAQLYEDAGETALEASTQLDRGCALAEVAELESAIAAFHCALRGLDPDRDAIQSIRAHQGIGSCYADLKLDAEAATALAAGRALYPRLADPRQRLQAEWLEARVLARAGELARPAALLAAIVDDLVAAGDLRRAVRAALHLAGVYAQHGREDELLAVAERVSWLLPSLQVHWTARQAALFGLRCTALRGAARVTVLARAADYLEGSHHRPDLPFTPTAAPRQTVEWELLSRGERLRARAVAGFSKRSLRKSAAELAAAERIAIAWPYEVATAIRILFDGAAAASGGGP
jgi:tetratricopeptide (TPR) repeat protein